MLFRSSKKRVWWCPGSALWTLPLHAAWTPEGPLTRYVFSYTPTLSTLLRSLSISSPPSHTRSPSTKQGSVLFVSEPDPGTMPPLKQAQVEENTIENIMKTHVTMTKLCGPDAKQENILSALDNHKWLHLACHGVQDTSDPFQSRFLLRGGRSLRLVNIVSKHLQIGRAHV